MNSYNKYIKYKNKYKKLIGGSSTTDEFIKKFNNYLLNFKIIKTDDGFNLVQITYQGRLISLLKFNQTELHILCKSLQFRNNELTSENTNLITKANMNNYLVIINILYNLFIDLISKKINNLFEYKLLIDESIIEIIIYNLKYIIKIKMHENAKYKYSLECSDFNYEFEDTLMLLKAIYYLFKVFAYKNSININDLPNTSNTNMNGNNTSTNINSNGNSNNTTSNINSNGNNKPNTGNSTNYNTTNYNNTNYNNPNNQYPYDSMNLFSTLLTLNLMAHVLGPHDIISVNYFDSSNNTVINDETNNTIINDETNNTVINDETNNQNIVNDETNNQNIVNDDNVSNDSGFESDSDFDFF